MAGDTLSHYEWHNPFINIYSLQWLLINLFGVYKPIDTDATISFVFPHSFYLLLTNCLPDCKYDRGGIVLWLTGCSSCPRGMEFQPLANSGKAINCGLGNQLRGEELQHELNKPSRALYQSRLFWWMGSHKPFAAVYNGFAVLFTIKGGGGVLGKRV